MLVALGSKENPYTPWVMVSLHNPFGDDDYSVSGNFAKKEHISINFDDYEDILVDTRIMRGHIPQRPHGAWTLLPLALILSPTRELLCQIHEEAKKFSYQTSVKVVGAYGGAPINQQLRDLERGVDILVATHGRLVDLLERARVSLSMVKYLALDEDFLLDATIVVFEEQVEKAFKEGIAHQNAQSIFVCLALSLLEEHVHAACKEITTLEKTNKLLEEESEQGEEENEGLISIGISCVGCK
eukprot:Gb_02786 [translate_table: standard]